ncbi:fimbrial protein [Serratia fonticola]|uniref:fimbrial protein n=1 Tax=Serratia fonticola TaxID=47917 RepID=UPI003BB66DBF
MNSKILTVGKRNKWAGWALALCSVALTVLHIPQAAGSTIVCNDPGDSYLSIPPMTYSGSADFPPIGQPIGQTGMFSRASLYYGCDIFGGTYDGRIAMPLLPNRTYTENGVTYPIYQTSVPGIGVIVGVREMLRQTKYTPVFPDNNVDFFLLLGGGSYPTLSVEVMAKLIVTGQLATGVYTIAQQPLVDIYPQPLNTGGEEVYPQDRTIYLRPTTLTITARTCQLASAAVQNVTLPPVAKSQFSGVGSSPNVGQNFLVSTQCEEGVNLYATMTDATNPTNTGNILTPGEGTTASGVGVQILRNDIPVAFGPDASAAGNLNQWYIGSAASGPGIYPFIIPLKARYVQTAANMTAGAVKARTTITFSYQ